MNELMEFIETLSLDEQLYWQISSTSGNASIEVMWKRENPKLPWRIRPKGSQVWTELAKEHVVAKLEKWHADVQQLEKLIGVSVMTQAVFADQIIQGASRLFGEAAVQTGIEDARQFLQSVSDTIREQTNQIEKQKKLAKFKLLSNSDFTH